MRIHKHNNKKTQFTKLNKSIQNVQPYIQWYKKWNEKNIKECVNMNEWIREDVRRKCNLNVVLWLALDGKEFLDSRSIGFIPVVYINADVLVLTRHYESHSRAGAGTLNVNSSNTCLTLLSSTNSTQQTTTCRITNSGPTICNNRTMTTPELHRNQSEPWAAIPHD